jgi:hypothetical protein
LRQVKVNKTQLIEVLKKNREGHRDEFLKAQEGFKKKVIETFEERLADARAGKKFNVWISMPEPEDHTADYDLALGMLEMEVDENVVLAEAEYRQLVNDDWGWKNQFTATNAMYTQRE